MNHSFNKAGLANHSSIVYNYFAGDGKLVDFLKQKDCKLSFEPKEQLKSLYEIIRHPVKIFNFLDLAKPFEFVVLRNGKGQKYGNWDPEVTEMIEEFRKQKSSHEHATGEKIAHTLVPAQE